MNTNNLYRLEKKDIHRSAHILAASFNDYSMFKHILGDQLNEETMKVFLNYLLKFSILYGEAYASSSELEGIILVTDFSNYTFNLVRAIRCGALSFMKYSPTIGRKFNEFDRFTMDIHKKNIVSPHQYIILLGVNPEKQRQGYGSKLLVPILQVSEEKGQPCYLETHGDENVAYYEKFGFKVVSKDIVTGSDIIQYSMIKE